MTAIFRNESLCSSILLLLVVSSFVKEIFLSRLTIVIKFA
jgi:hypothetical protein